MDILLYCIVQKLMKNSKLIFRKKIKDKFLVELIIIVVTVCPPIIYGIYSYHL